VSAVASGDENSVLTAVQLLWINLIMDTFAALALGEFQVHPAQSSSYDGYVDLFSPS
jgi:magnesium-transporting ATPase (P-type)